MYVNMQEGIDNESPYILRVYSTSHNKHYSQALTTDHMFSVHLVWPFVLVVFRNQLHFPLLSSITLVAHFLVHTL